jgi:hypothetical protein
MAGDLSRPAQTAAGGLGALDDGAANALAELARAREHLAVGDLVRAGFDLAGGGVEGVALLRARPTGSHHREREEAGQHPPRACRHASDPHVRLPSGSAAVAVLTPPLSGWYDGGAAPSILGVGGGV